ncbi:hypothetical protein TrST_g10499 [Triparma strigata]|uniref:Carboxypeptidase n=1 Tax=Triparma strigata TaxID=1606541 RepID=A0A9W7ENC9_9STRA|nr:hypothetical protein TrST_g10499 [Triparma strigata]
MRIALLLFTLGTAAAVFDKQKKDHLLSKNKIASESPISGFASSTDANPAESTAIDWGSAWDGPTQHAGFLNFYGERDDGRPSPEINTFFWYLPALNGDPDAPLLIWLQGGPGGSSLYGMFEEIGPMGIDSNMTIYPRDPMFNWNRKYSLIFLDNPCGVGFSFSADDSCYVTDEVQVGGDLRSALLQFYSMFPEQRPNDLYITGESYAGKYVPAFSFTIFDANKDLEDDDLQYINLKGLSIGDGAMSPPDQFKNFGDLLFYTGSIDSKEKAVFDDYDAKIQASLASGDNVGAFEHFDEMLNGDFYEYPTYYTNVTGLTNYFNFEQGDCGSCVPEYYDDWLDLAETRAKIHVGDLEYSSFNETVEVYLKEDWMRGVVDMLVPLMESSDIKVLVYSGQNDIILGAPLTEQFLDGLEWQGADDYDATEKEVWRVDSDTEQGQNDPIAGYRKTVSKWGFTYAVVRGAGHMVPGDQPERSYDLITTFVDA